MAKNPLIMKKVEVGRMQTPERQSMGILDDFKTGKVDITKELHCQTFTMPTGAVAGHVLTVDANGVGTWQAPPTTWLQTYVWATWECQYGRDTPSITKTFDYDEYTSTMTDTVAGDVGDSNLYITTMLTGDFDIQVDYKDYNYDLGSVGTYDGLVFGDTPDWSGATTFGIYRCYDPGAPNPNFYCAISWGLTFESSGATTDTAGKLRITRVGDLIKWYYWDTTALSWTLLAQENYTADNMYVYLYQTQADDGVNVPCTSGITFHNFVINSGTFV